jgi:shikimate kinase
MIHLIGPGGAGKTTTGLALATRLGARFVDLDAEFTSRYGDISCYLEVDGYAAYASRNVALLSELANAPNQPDIVALSSGFMTYADDVHPGYPRWRQCVASSPHTFVLLPSFELETCVKETVRRQLGRPFARPAEREEQVIRARFPVYVGLASRKIETIQPLENVISEMISALSALK